MAHVACRNVPWQGLTLGSVCNIQRSLLPFILFCLLFLVFLVVFVSSTSNRGFCKHIIEESHCTDYILVYQPGKMFFFLRKFFTQDNSKLKVDNEELGRKK